MANSTIQLSELRSTVGDVVNRVSLRGDRIVVSRNGKEVAAVVPMEDLLLLRKLEDRIDLAAARRALKEDGENVSLERLKKELGL